MTAVRTPRLALVPSEPGIPGLRAALQEDPGLTLLGAPDGLGSLVGLIAEHELDVALVEVEDPAAALAALSPLAAHEPLPTTVIALTGGGAADLLHALRRLGLHAEEIDPSLSAAEIRELLAQLAEAGG